MDKYQIIAAAVQSALGFSRSPESVAYYSFLASRTEVRDGVTCIILGDGDQERLKELGDSCADAFLRHNGTN